MNDLALHFSDPELADDYFPSINRIASALKLASLSRDEYPVEAWAIVELVNEKLQTLERDRFQG